LVLNIRKEFKHYDFGGMRGMSSRLQWAKNRTL
jgi:hypothetical protein